MTGRAADAADAVVRYWPIISATASAVSSPRSRNLSSWCTASSRFVYNRTSLAFLRLAFRQPWYLIDLKIILIWLINLALTNSILTDK